MKLQIHRHLLQISSFDVNSAMDYSQKVDYFGPRAHIGLNQMKNLEIMINFDRIASIWAIFP